jgi:iron complex outermembrane receptor protein
MSIHRQGAGGGARIFAGVILACAMPAWAEDKPSPVVAAAPVGQGAGSRSNEVQEVVVTAERRSEKLSEIPISITAVTGTALEQAGISTTLDLGKVVPGFSMYVNGAYAQPVIRGISSSSSSPGDSSNIAVLVDGVYIASQAGQLFDLPDIDRIEILKGPQGTLFGRNAEGGAVLVNTLDPSLSDFTGHLSFSYGSFNQVTGKAFVSVPITDKIAASLSVLSNTNDGWDHNLLDGGAATGGLNEKMARAQVLFQISDDLKLTWSTLYSYRNDASAFSGEPLDGNTIGKLFPGTIFGTSPYQVALNGPVNVYTRTFMTSLTAQYSSDAGTLTSITAYTQGSVKDGVDGDYSTAPLVFYIITEPNREFSQDLNFASSNFGRFSYNIGVFYFQGDEEYDPLDVSATAASPVFFAGYGTIKTQAAAAYAELHADVTDDIQATAGVRESGEQKQIYGCEVCGRAEPFAGQQDFYRFTPRFSLKYSLPMNSNVYFTYSKGFKSGTADPLTSNGVFVSPETLNAFEIGGHSHILPNLEFNAAAFLYDYSNIQVQTTVGTQSVLQNAAAATIKGFEADAVWRVTNDVTAKLGATYLDAIYDSYPNAVVDAPISGIQQQTTIDASGKSMVRSPKWSGNASLNYAHEFGLGTIFADTNLYYTSKWFPEAGNRVVQAGYATFDAQLGVEPGNAGWRITLWGKNLSGTKYIEAFSINGETDGVAYAEPRSVGVRIDYQF